MTVQSRENPLQTVEDRRWLRICSDPYADPREGRFAQVETPEGIIHRGYVVGADYAPLEPTPSVVVFEGWEVVSVWVDSGGSVITDRYGRNLPQPSDTGSGGVTWHRQEDPKNPSRRERYYVHNRTPIPGPRRFPWSW